MKNQKLFSILNVICLLFAVALFYSCGSDDELTTTNNTDTTNTDCTDVNTVKDLSDRGVCNETLSYNNEVNIIVGDGKKIITSNAIPNHQVGLFGNVSGSLNPNAIAPNYGTYTITNTPEIAASVTPLLSTTNGPQYELGVLNNGVLLDPEAAEPWPHEGMFSPGSNWEWNLDAMSINLGLDCNNAHVQPTGKYHYHGAPTLYLESINASASEMTLVGYAADGFPIYYKYAYSNADDAGSTVSTMNSSYQLKSGERPGDGIDAPCGTYSGIYTNDYEYVASLGDLDECNGRVGVTPEYPSGTYYYMITDAFPFLPRCLKGTPSNDFKFQ